MSKEPAQWLKWDAHKAGLLDERCRQMLNEFYATGSNCFKASTIRAPRGVETKTGQQIPVHDGHYRGNSLDQERVVIRLPNQSLPRKYMPWLPEIVGKPPYRRRTSKGVCVGHQFSVPLKRALHHSSWDPETTIPRLCSLEHCRLDYWKRKPAQA